MYLKKGIKNMRKRITKLDIAYDDFEKRYSNMNEEDFTKAINERVNELESKIITKDPADYNPKIKDLRKVVSDKRSLIIKLEGKEDAKVKEIIEKTKTEISEIQEEIEKEIERATAEIERNNINIKKEISDLKLNARGYSKYKNQIVKIREYQKILDNKLKEQIQIRDNSLANIKNAEKELKGLNKTLTELLNKSKEKELDDSDKDNYEALLLRKQAVEETINKQQLICENAKIRILDLQSKIAKCNMAWKTLFTDKDWDDIHARAIEKNTRYTRITPEKEARLTGKEDSKDADKGATISGSNGSARRTETINSDRDLFMEDKYPGSYHTDARSYRKEEEPLWRRLWNKILKRNDKTAQETLEKNSDESKEKLKPEGENINGGESDKKTVDKNTANNEAKQKSEIQPERDEFIEALRRYVDPEYREKVNEAKDAESRKKHEPKLNQSKDSHDDRDDR